MINVGYCLLLGRSYITVIYNLGIKVSFWKYVHLNFQDEEVFIVIIMSDTVKKEWEKIQCITQVYNGS